MDNLRSTIEINTEGVEEYLAALEASRREIMAIERILRTDAFTGTGVGMHLFWLIYSILVVSFNVSILTNTIFNKISDSLSKTFLSIMTGVCGIILLYNAYKMIREFGEPKKKNNKQPKSNTGQTITITST